MAIPLSRRLTMARQHGGYETEAALAKAASELSGKEITAEEISGLESGSRKLSRHLIALAAACKVRPPWLISGDEPMLPGGQTSEVNSSELKLSPEEVELVKAWRDLDVLVVRPAMWALIQDRVAITRLGLVEWEKQRAADSKKN